MAGEMSQSEVTRDAYPELFALRDALKRRGIVSEPRAFDQYQGPYLAVRGVGAVWYCGSEPSMLCIERGFSIGNPGAWDTEGASWVIETTDDAYSHGCYTVRQAAKRIAALYDQRMQERIGREIAAAYI